MAARRLATQIEEYFTPEVEFWEHEKLLGGGSWGIAILLKEKEHKFGKPLRIVIKVGSSVTGQAQLRLEMDYYKKDLKMVNGAKHIIRMLGCVEDRDPDLSVNRFPPLEFAFRAILPINGPILALEYLDGGDRFSGPCSYAFMLYFVTMIPTVIYRPGIYRGEQTAAGVVLHTPPAEDPYPWLDPQLAGLLAECQYYDASKRPGLEQLLARAKFAVLNRVPESFPEPEHETDEYIRYFHQRYVLNFTRRPAFGPPRPPDGPAQFPA
ncbi:hypothetical protein EKO27_g490 [Xylaria grammica]|uniref:Protein kinase domain-containing protein n=1 Tax=Xylaria grammica TaxID=363999 RepID=A0A439DJN5_9PEZI|nr:hypothetical protein EKO27_g490 [Xylaria grammica]